MEKSYKKWLIGVFAAIVIILGAVGTLNAVVDPYFHFHEPLKGFKYSLGDQRFINYGIARTFDYDALITGSSMTENFKTSELDALFGVNSVKLPFSGACYKETNDLVVSALKHNSNLKMVVEGLDCIRFFSGANDSDYANFPDYLYDDNPFNDVAYLFNINAAITSRDILNRKNPADNGINFDEYSSWENSFSFGKETVDENYARNEVVRVEEQLPVTEEEYATIRENITQNIISTVVANPQVEFYYFITPYSIAYMDYYKLEGKLERQLLAEKYIIELLLPYENAHIFSFFLESEVIENMDNYRDVGHYNSAVNSMILKWMKEGHGLLTKDNYEEYCRKEKEYFYSFDYEEYFKVWD